MKVPADTSVIEQLPLSLSAAIHAFAGENIDVAIVLGSGLGAFASTIEIESSVSTKDLPGYPVSTIVGHEGRLLLGRAHGLRLLLFQGRVHGYEGYDANAAALPARIAAFLGARLLLLTNAAGGLHPTLDAGDLMLITDLLVLPAAIKMGLELHDAALLNTPLPRPLFSEDILETVRHAAADAGIGLREGTYGFCSGPTYETRAEIAFFRLAGVHAAGMSTAPEIIAAARTALPFVGISCITNMASTVAQSVTHEEVTTVAAQASDRLSRLVHALLSRI